MRVRIERTERALFTAPVREHHLECRIAPWDDAGQRLRHLEVVVEPETRVASHRDCFGNQMHRAAVLAPHEACTVRMVAEVESVPLDQRPSESVPLAREGRWISDSLHQAPRLWDFVLHRSGLVPHAPTLQQLLRPASDDPGGDAAETALPVRREEVALRAQLHEACVWLRRGISWDPDLAPAASLDELRGRERAAAADLAHGLIAIVRGWQVPARFVIGYLAPHGRATATGSQTQMLHAWAEVLLPGRGWWGLDATRDAAAGYAVDERYIRLAVGRDLTDVGALRRSHKGGGELERTETELVVSPCS